MVAEKDNPLTESRQYTRPYTSCLGRIRKRTRHVWVVYEDVHVMFGSYTNPYTSYGDPYTRLTGRTRSDHANHVGICVT